MIYIFIIFHKTELLNLIIRFIRKFLKQFLTIYIFKIYPLYLFYLKYFLFNIIENKQDISNNRLSCVFIRI